MRNLLAVLSIFLSVFFYAQGSTNRFNNEEGQSSQSSGYDGRINAADGAVIDNNAPEGAADDDDGPPNPGDPVPIDQYGGLLIVTGVAIIVYTTKKRKNLLSSK